MGTGAVLLCLTNAMGCKYALNGIRLAKGLEKVLIRRLEISTFRLARGVSLDFSQKISVVHPR